MQKDDFVVRKFPNLSALACEGEGRPLRVCIATEEIVGPMKNGGIATTYYHLARMLQELGHKVTVLYLKGDRVSEKNTAHWVKWYRQLGIEFVPLPLETIPQRGFSTFWQQRYYAFYRWLLEQPTFDVVHTSEWRGGAMYVLGAKRLGLAFKDTLFLVKASSPHIWNRHYQMRTIETDGMLASSYAEQKTIEWADVVIGGSAHLLSFMEDMGYAMPEGRIYVQPNVIDLEGMEIPDHRPSYEYGETVQSDELVFFGRLEARKGLEIFCDAIDRLVFQGVVPKKIYFMGKQGQNLPNQPDTPTIEVIKSRAAQWPIDVVIKDSFDPQQAIAFLCEKPRLAVMPSLIENSTMCVYEALVHRIPFLATDTGGTAELIHPRYHEATLTEPHPEVLAKDLARLIKHGGTVAAPAFQPDDNLAIWRQFHTYLSRRIKQAGIADVVADMSYDASSLPDPGRVSRAIVPASNMVADVREASASLIIYFTDDLYGLELSFRAIQGQKTAFDEVILVVDGHIAKDSMDYYVRLKQELESHGVRVIETEHQCIAASYNQAAGMATHDVLVFLRAGMHIPRPDMAQVLKTAYAHEHVQATVSVYDLIAEPDSNRSAGRHRYLPMGGDIAAHLIHDGAMGSECFAVRKDTFEQLGGFYPSYHVSHVQAAFQAKLVHEGVELWVIPEVLYEQYGDHQALKYNLRSGQYLRIKPILDAASPGMRRFFLRFGEHVESGSVAQLKKSSDSQTASYGFEIISSGDQKLLRGEMIGVAIDKEEGTFYVFMRANESDADKLVHVVLNGNPLAQLNLDPLGNAYRVSAWQLQVSDVTRSLNHLVFKCMKGGRNEIMRRLNLVVSADGRMYVLSKVPAVIGGGNIKTAQVALPAGSPVDRAKRRAKLIAKAVLRR